MPGFRPAGVLDAPGIAALHADSWRRHYRGAYADAYLDGDVEADRLAVWSARLAEPAHTATILAEEDGHLTGFVHVVLDHDPKWGSLVDNLHVSYARHRTGLGRRLLARAARAVPAGPLYLFVLEQNTAAQAFYAACGGTNVETLPVAGDPARLNGTPTKHRITWPDITPLLTPGP